MPPPPPGPSLAQSRPAARLTVHRSNRVENLAVDLAARLYLSPPADPLEPVRVLVGSRGMERYLRHALAERLGICTHLSFEFPATALLALLDGALGRPPTATSAYTPDVMALSMLGLWSSMPPEALGHVGRYLGPTRAPWDRKAYALARSMADVFDRYLHYRPEYARAFEAGRVPPTLADDRDARVQAEIFSRLVAHAEEPHFVGRVGALDALEVAAGPLPSTLHVFGLSALPPAYMHVLASLSRFVDVDLYLFCPSNRYWGDLRTAREANAELRRAKTVEAAAQLEAHLAQQSPILTSLGRTSRDFQLVLEDLAGGYEDGALFTDPRELARAAGRPPTLLEALQGDVLELTSRTDLAAEGARDERRIDAGDDSFRVHACAGPARQIEALRDVLLDMLERRPELELGDIVVMTPDVATYAPLIAAIFDGEQPGAGTGRPKLRVSISDRALREDSPVAAALSSLLSLAEERVTATRVLDLLASAPVRHRFGVTDEELSTIRGWVLDSGIRWGVDAEDRVAAGRPVDGTHTFRFGLARLALGAAMGQGGLVLGAVPVGPLDPEGVDLAGRFLAFTDALFEHRAALRAPGTVPELVARARAGLDALTSAPTERLLDAARVRDALSRLVADAQRAGFTDTLSIAAFRACLDARLDVDPGGDRPITAAITVCALSPMRAVPFEVICLVGMDDGVFPRRGSQAGFDLTERRPQVGDRNPAEEDRHLLLEALLSARRSLHIFYSGRDVRTGVDNHPAVPVAELLAFVDESFEREEGARVVVRHGLHPFSASDYLPSMPSDDGVPDALPRSFDARALAAAQNLRGPRAVRPGPLGSGTLSAPTRDVVSPDALAAFLRRPTRALLSQRLHVRFADEEAALSDTDPTDVGGLAAYALKESLVAAGLRGDADWDAIAAEARATGALPQGTPGAILLDDMVASARAVVDAAAPLLASSARELMVEATFDEGRLEGLLPAVYREGELVFVGCSAPDRASRLLPAWVSLLALQAQSPAPCRATVIGLDKDKGVATVELALPGSAEARQQTARDTLGSLVSLWAEGLERPLMLFEKASLAFVHARAKGKELDAQLREAKSAFVSGEHRFGDDADPFVALAYPDDAAPFDASAQARDEFTALAERVYGPLLAARVQEK